MAAKNRAFDRFGRPQGSQHFGEDFKPIYELGPNADSVLVPYDPSLFPGSHAMPSYSAVPYSQMAAHPTPGPMSIWDRARNALQEDVLVPLLRLGLFFGGHGNAVHRMY